MKLKMVLLVGGALAMSGCTAVGAAVGAGASAGIAASQEGGIARAVDDAAIQIAINDLWFQYSVEAFRKLDLTINDGRVLITGVVQNPEHRVEAVRLAWQPEGVKQVINEVRVAEGKGVVGYAKDTWITTRFRTALTFERDIESINYSIDTVQGTVYLMGYANSQGELNRVIEIGRTIPGVESVVSYVEVYEAQQRYVPGQASQAQTFEQPSVAVPSENDPTIITPQPGVNSGAQVDTLGAPQNLQPNDVYSQPIERQRL